MANGPANRAAQYNGWHGNAALGVAMNDGRQVTRRGFKNRIGVLFLAPVAANEFFDK